MESFVATYVVNVSSTKLFGKSNPENQAGYQGDQNGKTADSPCHDDGDAEVTHPGQDEVGESQYGVYNSIDEGKFHHYVEQLRAFVLRLHQELRHYEPIN